jgi:hopanoid biosynthesis associated protein HpnK
MKLSFVYPIYNEIGNLPRLLGEAERIASGLFPEHEVVLVDDGSTDGSGEFIDHLASRHRNAQALHHIRNRGLGAAIVTGLTHATGDLILYMDSDFPVSAEEARAALASLPAEADLLIGYRLGRAEGPRREVMSWTYNRLIRCGFGLGVRDVNFAFKLLRRSLLERMRLRSEGSFIDAEILLEARRLGASIAEVGIHYHPRVAGRSTAASSRVVLRILGEMWHYWRHGRRRRERPRVIINADDLGLCEAVNLGIAEAHDRGPVTSTSLMPTGEAFDHAVALARARPALDLGLHLALTQTRPVLPAASVPSLVDGSGRFPRDWRAFLPRYLRSAVRREEMARELRAQVERARQAGLRPSHLDGHQHLHMLPGVLEIVTDLAGEYGIGAIRCPDQRRGQPGVGLLGTARRRAELSGLRLLCRAGRRRAQACGLLMPDHFRGFAEAGRWDASSLARAVHDVDDGLTEICCHPGADDRIASTFPWGYSWERELSALVHPAIASALVAARVQLTTYRECVEGANGRESA